MPEILIIIDGMQDLTYEILQHQTPFYAGQSSSFLALQKDAHIGYIATIPNGFEPDTMTGILTLLGVSADKIPHGRSYLESLAHGLTVQPTDLLLRANWVKMSALGNLELSGASIPAAIKCNMIKWLYTMEEELVTIGSYQNLHVIKNGEQYFSTLQTFPPHQNIGLDYPELLPRGNELANRLSELAKAMYKIFAPYSILHWSPSVPHVLPHFYQLYKKQAVMISATPVVQGIAKCMGMELSIPLGATGDTDTDLVAKSKQALQSLKENKVVILHVGGTDEATHRKNPVEKSEFINRIDTELLAPILKSMKKNWKLLLTSDHEAYCTTGGHTTLPVKFWFYDKYNKAKKQDYGLVQEGNAMSVLLNRRGK